MTSTTRISLAEGTELIRDTLTAAGATIEASTSCGDAPSAAEAEGQVGHGCSRLGDYVAQLRSGKINPNAGIRTMSQYAASILIDADCGFAYPALDAARSAVIPVAEDLGIAIVGITNSHHCGALSVQVDRIARAGLIGLMVANAPKAIAPWGAHEPLFGTNPIAFAVPRDGADPLVIDLSLSKVARGKVMNAYKNGQDIPEGWALDAAGAPTTNAKAALEGTMLPIGGAKGTALALMVEILSAMFNGASASYQATSFFDPSGDPPRVGQTLIAIKPRSGADFATRLENLLTMIETMDGARLPGTRRLATIRSSRTEGILVPTHYLELARKLANEH